MKLKKATLFQVFKYGVYAAVFTNVFLFLQKEVASSAHRFADGFSWTNFLEAYTSTIDTAAWAVLLLLFELETYIISEEKMKGSLQWLFRIIRGLCYAVVVSSFIGYCNNYGWLMSFESINIQSLCEVVGQSWMVELDEFKKIAASDCGALAKGEEFFKYSSKNIYTDNHFLNETFWLARVDILNSLAWILVVVVLEIDVFLQYKNKFSGRAFTISKYIKNVLYLTLLGAAIYWGIFGDFLEFWDAFLWIVAFFFIELNLIEWKNEKLPRNHIKKEI